MSGVQAVRTPQIVSPASTTGTTSAAQPLLPDAEPPSPASMTDAMSALYLSIEMLGTSSMQVGESQVRADETAQNQELQEEQAALQRQEQEQATHGRGFFSSIGDLLGDEVNDATHLRVVQAVKDAVDDTEQAWNSPAFWSDLEKGALVVAKVSAVVGSAVVTAASFGAGAATIAGAALVLSVGGEVVSDTRCFGNASGLVGAGLDVAGAVVGGVGTFAVGTAVASKTATAIGVSFSAVGGEAQMVAGVAHVESQVFAADAEQAGADAQQAIDRGQELQQVETGTLDDLKAADKTKKGTLEALQGAIQAESLATAAAAPVTLKG